MQINKPHTSTETLNYYQEQYKKLAKIKQEIRCAMLEDLLEIIEKSSHAFTGEMITSSLIRNISTKLQELNNDSKSESPQKTYAHTHYSRYVLGECSTEHGNHNGNCVGTDRCIKNLEQKLIQCHSELDSESKKLKAKEQECEKLKERLKCKCFDPSSKQVRCNSYLRIAEDYKVDLTELNRIKIENKKLEEELKDCQQNALNRYIDNNIQCVLPSNCMFVNRYKQALEKIEEIAKQGLKPICYKSNCNICQCYDGDDSKIAITNLINNYFTENGQFADGNHDFDEALEGLVENERARCNKAKPISEQILAIINEVKDV